MKFKTQILCLAMMTLVFAALLSFAPAVAQAQEAQPAVVTATVGAEAAPLIVALASSHPWILTLVSVIGTLRFFFKPIVSLIEAWVKSTPSTADDAFVEKVEASKSWKAISWAIDLLASIKLGPQFTATPAAPSPNATTPTNGASL